MPPSRPSRRFVTLKPPARPTSSPRTTNKTSSAVALCVLRMERLLIPRTRTSYSSSSTAPGVAGPSRPMRRSRQESLRAPMSTSRRRPTGLTIFSARTTTALPLSARILSPRPPASRSRPTRRRLLSALLAISTSKERQREPHCPRPSPPGEPKLWCD